MKNPTVKNIKEILQNSTLSQIVKKANLIAELNEKISQILPKHYLGLYRIINLQDNSLVLEVQNGTISQGLRFQQAHLLALIQAHYPEITQLEFKIQPNFNLRGK